MLIGVLSQSCQATQFNYFDPLTATFKNNVIPNFAGIVGSSIAVGEGNDIWLSESDYHKLYYYSYEHNIWNEVSLSPLPGAFIYTMEWDSLNNYLLLSLIDNYGNAGVLAKASNEEYPPSRITIMTPGPLAGYGDLTSIATIQQDDNSSNYGFCFLFFSIFRIIY